MKMAQDLWSKAKMAEERVPSADKLKANGGLPLVDSRSPSPSSGPCACSAGTSPSTSSSSLESSSTDCELSYSQSRSDADPMVDPDHELNAPDTRSSISDNSTGQISSVPLMYEWDPEFLSTVKPLLFRKTMGRPLSGGDGIVLLYDDQYYVKSAAKPLHEITPVYKEGILLKEQLKGNKQHSICLLALESSVIANCIT
jgi:hypothetical protein